MNLIEILEDGGGSPCRIVEVAVNDGGFFKTREAHRLGLVGREDDVSTSRKWLGVERRGRGRGWRRRRRCSRGDRRRVGSRLLGADRRAGPKQGDQHT